MYHTNRANSIRALLGARDKMNHSEKRVQANLAAHGERTLRKPYEKPEVRFERVFETLAMSCGKVQTTQASCSHNRKAS
jgi:hypothetical protein